MVKSQPKIKELWNNLKKKIKILDVAKTKFIKEQLKINSKILVLINKEGKVVKQLEDDIGFIVLNQTNFKSHNNHSVSDQGIITNNYFKAQVLDVDDKSFNGVTIHLVSVITGIVSINDLELTVEVDEERHNNLNKNNFASKVFLGFLEHNFEIKQENLVKTFISEKDFKVNISKEIPVTKKNIFLLRNQINEFLSLTNFNKREEHFLIKKINNKKWETFSTLKKIEIKHISNDKESLTVTFLVGQTLISQYFDDRKKELLFEINNLNKKIKAINHKQLSEFYPPQTVINSYEKLVILHCQYLKLKNNFLEFQIKHHEVIENLINHLEGTQYSEKLKDYEIIHINFSHFLLNEKLLYQKTNKILSEINNKILFVSNSGSENSFLVIAPTNDLKMTVNFKPLINQFLPPTIKKINYNDSNILIESDNYQAITDFISTMVNFLKISNKKYE